MSEYHKKLEAESAGKAYQIPAEKRHDDFVSFVNDVWFPLQVRDGKHISRKEANTMTRNELIAQIETLRNLETLIEEAKREAETVRDSIKAEMEAVETEELSAGGYIVRWTSVLSTRFDTKSFKEKFGEEVYKAFTKQVASRRFSISA